MNERLLDIMEQWFWSILGVLLLVFTGISFITGNLICLVALIALVLLGMFVFEIFEHMIENQIEDEDEEL